MVGALPAYPQGTLRRFWWWSAQIPWRGLGLYSPQALLALPAAYASSQFAAHHNVFPFPFNIMLGIAFEWTYIGTLAVAGALSTNKWYKAVNGAAVFASIVFVTLHAADKYGLLESLTSPAWMLFFSLIHAVPLAGLNFVYGLLVHNHLGAIAKYEEAERKEEKKKEEEERKRREAEEAAVRYKCLTCGAGFPTTNALNGHMKTHAKQI